MTHRPAVVTRHIFARAFSFGVGARLMDPYHDMAVALQHDGNFVTAIRGRTLRTPWTICPEATGRLVAFIGAPLDPAQKHQHVIDQYWQCTHLMDLARFAIRQAAIAVPRNYRITVDAPNSDQPENLFARVETNGKTLLNWRVRNGIVVEPAQFLGVAMKGRMEVGDVIRADPGLHEAAMMLRRAILVFRGRPALRAATAAEVPQLRGACYSFQPQHAARAVRTLQASHAVLASTR